MAEVSDLIPASFDAQVWADEWLRITKDHPDVPTDRETVIGWFANALMRGYDEGRKPQPQPIDNTPEGCILVAHDTGDGWYLGVEDSHGETVAMLEWPKSWPETMSAERLREIGFEVV